MKPQVTSKDQDYEESIEHFLTRDGKKLAYRAFRPSSPVLRVVGLHGIISHSGWYLQSSRYLASRGIEVHFLDRRGSGANSADRGDIEDSEVWFQDVEDFLASVAPTTEGIPTALMGISWGGKLAATLAARHPNRFDGLAMLCPGLYSAQRPKVPTRWKFKTGLMLGFAKLRVNIPLQEPTLFTTTPEWVHYIEKDPTTLRKMSLRLAVADQKLTNECLSSAKRIATRTLLVLAGRDRIVLNEKVREYLEDISSDEKELIEFEDGAHTLEFEPEPTAYFEALASWLLALAARPASINVPL